MSVHINAEHLLVDHFNSYMSNVVKWCCERFAGQADGCGQCSIGDDCQSRTHFPEISTDSFAGKAAATVILYLISKHWTNFNLIADCLSSLYLYDDSLHI